MKTDYISREAARPDAFCDGVSCQECQFLKNSVTGGCRVDDFIKAIPAADVRPVVYCKDCIYDDNCFAQSILEEMSRIPFDKNRFFCADGERREGGADG